METKNQKFRRLAENRANKIIALISLLGNLSNTRNYEYSEKEIKHLFKSIETSLKKTKSKFLSRDKKDSFNF